MFLGGRWDSVVGVSWWNERWQNGTDPSWDYTVDTTMRLQDVPSLAQTVQSILTEYNDALHKRPVFG